MVCTINNNIHVNIPCHLYVLLNWSTLWYCNIEVESNFLSESLAAYDKSTTDLVMSFTVNLAFVNYFDDLLTWYRRCSYFTELDNALTESTYFFAIIWV